VIPVSKDFVAAADELARALPARADVDDRDEEAGRKSGWGDAVGAHDRVVARRKQRAAASRCACARAEKTMTKDDLIAEAPRTACAATRSSSNAPRRFLSLLSGRRPCFGDAFFLGLEAEWTSAPACRLVDLPQENARAEMGLPS